MEEQEISIPDEIAEIGKLLSDPERWTAENVAESKKKGFMQTLCLSGSALVGSRRRGETVQLGSG